VAGLLGSALGAQLLGRGHFVSDRTTERVDVLVDGAPTIAHDPASEFVTSR
jgi:hypothetical protein